MTEERRAAIRKASDDVASMALLLSMIRVPREVEDPHALESALHWLGAELDTRAAQIMEANDQCA